MDNYFDSTRFSHFYEYNYSKWFEELQHNGKQISDVERKEFVSIIDDFVDTFQVYVAFLREELDRIIDQHDEYHNIDRLLMRTSLFVSFTMMDILVACKLMLLADKDYDKKFVRGKIYVILNEGFKKLYGFDQNNSPKTVWARLAACINVFPESIRQQYQEVEINLKKYSESSTWWKEERDIETHLDLDNLLKSRDEGIDESKVMMHSLKLYNTLLAVNVFLSNANKCLFNTLLKHYNRQ